MARTKKSADFDSILAKSSKDYDLDVESPYEDNVKLMSTGNLAIDHILGGGFGVGRIAEILGDPSSGKSTCATQTAAWVQKQIKNGHPDYVGKYILYMDHERTFDARYATNLGLDVADDSTFLYKKPRTLEQSVNFVRKLTDTGRIALVLFDSVAEMLPEGIMAKDVGEATFALRARLMKDSLDTLNSAFDENLTTALFINHAMEKINTSGYGAPVVNTPGGKALKYYSTQRLHFIHIKALKAAKYNALTNEVEDSVDGSDTLVKCIKNKIAPAWKSARIRVRFNRGFDNYYTAFQILINHNLITKAGGGYYFFHKVPSLIHPDMPLSEQKARTEPRPYLRGDHTFFDFADSHPEWADTLLEEASVVLDSAISLELNGMDSIDKFSIEDSLESSEDA